MNKRQAQLDAATRIAMRHPDLHPWHVAVTACNAASRADFEAFLAGLLHDSLEDGYATVEELEDAGFRDPVLGAVQVLTRQDGEKYSDYIARIKSFGATVPEGSSAESLREVGRLARRVKLADALVNLERCKSDFGYGGLEERYRWVVGELS